jgi:hypothetical protein
VCSRGQSLLDPQGPLAIGGTDPADERGGLAYLEWLLDRFAERDDVDVISHHTSCCASTRGRAAHHMAGPRWGTVYGESFDMGCKPT